MQSIFTTFWRHIFGRDTSQVEPRAHAFGHTFARLKLLRGLGFTPGCICDVGASDGRWSRECLEIFPEAEYFCVEPLDENQSGLAQLSAKHPNVHHWQGCLGPMTGTVALNVDGAGTSVLRGHWGNPYGIQREVRVETLDNLVQKGVAQQPDLIKLDVQGYELEVLKGAGRTLPGVQAIIAEVSFYSFQHHMPIFHEVAEHLTAHGFVVADILSLSLRPLDDTVGQSDVLFMQATHPLRSDNKWDHDSVY